jgi:regulation of enolase protein 1 (concanavalin A-like superfamily)
MYYNVDMFDAQGLARPSPSLTENCMGWSEFESLVKRLTRDINGDGIIDVYGFEKTFNANRVHFWMIPAGAEIYANGDNSRSALNSEAAVKGMEFLQHLRWNVGGIAPPGVSASWGAGKSAIMEDGSWRLASTLGVKQDGSPKMPFTWNVFPMPLGPAGVRATMANIDGYAINRNTKCLPEAYALAKFLAGPEANAIKAKYVALQPANRRVVPEYIRLMRSLNRDLYEVDVHVFTDAGPYAYPQPLYSNQEAASSLIGDLVTRIIDRNQPARSVWMEGIERLNRILATVIQHIDISMPEPLSWSGAKWSRQDLNVDVAGSAVVKDGKLYLSAAGADIWGSKDGFGFVHQKVKGNFTASVRLHRAPVGDSWAKAGLMVRAALDASAPHVTAMGTGANGIITQYRLESMGSSVSAGGRQTKWKNGDPVYLKMVRRGTEVLTYWSADGEKWTVFDRVRLHLGDEVYVGPAVTSHLGAELGEAIFSDWELVVD